jgi:hypothetical protein
MTDARGPAHRARSRRCPHCSDQEHLIALGGPPAPCGLRADCGRRASESVLLDAAAHHRSLATMPGYHRGRPPRNKGELYPADPPTVEEIVAVMRSIGDRAEGHRLRALAVLLWRAGLRISEALSLHEGDLDRSRGAVLVRRGKGGKRREVGMTAGRGSSLSPGSRSAASSRPERCCAWSVGRPRAGVGKHQGRDPTPARTRQPGHHQHLPSRHRQQRDQ